MSPLRPPPPRRFVLTSILRYKDLNRPVEKLADGLDLGIVTMHTVVAFPFDVVHVRFVFDKVPKVFLVLGLLL